MEIFPSEIWENILERIKYSKQIANVFEAFPELKAIRLYHKNKVIWLFEKVLPHLVNTLVTKLIKYKREKCWTASQDELLKLRLVCKNWKQAVDTVLTNELIPCPHQSHFNNLGMCIFRTSDQVNVFLHDMGQFSDNPFPGHAIFLKPNKPLHQFSHLLIQSSVKLFEKFGEHIFRLEIDIRDNFSISHLEMCQNILKCLRYSPNLIF